jgi:hypothetical protein
MLGFQNIFVEKIVDFDSKYCYYMTKFYHNSSFKENRKFCSENWSKSPKIEIITLTAQVISWITCKSEANHTYASLCRETWREKVMVRSLHLST